MCIDCSYSFSMEIEPECVWFEQSASQIEPVDYADVVADRLDLRPLFQLRPSTVRAA